MDKLEDLIKENIKPKELLDYVEKKLSKYPPILKRSFVEYENPDSVNLARPDNERVSNEFRVMQWNLLAKGLYSVQEFTKEIEEEGLPIEQFDFENFRLWRALQELVQYECDVICVQEADFYEKIKPYMHALGYTSIFCPKYASPCLGIPNNIGPDGSAIFYRLSMFQIVNMSCERVDLDDYLSNSQVFIILTLKHIKTNKHLTFVCIHLKSKEEYHQKRSNQIKYILNKCRQHLYISSLGNLQIENLIMCGDFNGEPFEEFYRQIVNDYNNDCFRINMLDAYTVTAKHGAKQPTTIKKSKKVQIKRAIDYIFFNADALAVQRHLSLPKVGEIDNLPNLSYSSDHLSLVCDFKFI